MNKPPKNRGYVGSTVCVD